MGTLDDLRTLGEFPAVEEWQKRREWYGSTVVSSELATVIVLADAAIEALTRMAVIADEARGYWKQRTESAEAELARLKPLIEERDDLCDKLSDWTIAADRHGVPDELEESPEEAFDFVQQKAEAEVARLEWMLDEALHDHMMVVEGEFGLPPEERHGGFEREHKAGLAARYEAEHK